MTELIEDPGPLPVEEIYTDAPASVKLPPRLNHKQISDIKHNYWTPFTKEFAQKVVTETRFRIDAPIPVLSESDITDITTGAQKCPHCRGTNNLLLRTRGLDTGIVVRFSYNCVCMNPLTLHRLWSDPSIVPARFQHVRMETLAPFPKLKLSLARQKEIIDLIHEEQEASYLLYGPPGQGKTHCMTALYRAALERWVAFEATHQKCRKSVFRITASILLDQHVAWENRNKETYDTPEPDVSVRAILEAIKDGYRVSLFIDELDKIRASDFKMEILNKLVDLIWSANGQVVATSNMTMDEMTFKWGGNEAGTLLRRICEGEGCFSVLFDDTYGKNGLSGVTSEVAAPQNRDEDDEDVIADSAPAKTTSARPPKTSSAAEHGARKGRGGLRSQFNIVQPKA